VDSETADAVESVHVSGDDPRSVVAYWLSTHVAQYAAILDVLEASVDDLRPAQIANQLRGTGHPLGDDVVIRRLEKLHEWAVVTGRSDPSDARVAAQLLARNFRYSMTAQGRRIHRVYGEMLTENIVREIPIARRRPQPRFPGSSTHPSVPNAQLARPCRAPTEA
jgi:hypothetical protein